MIPVWPDQKDNEELEELARKWTTTGLTRLLFPTSNNIDRNELRTRLGLVGVNKDDEYFDRMVVRVKELRSDAQKYYETRISTVIIDCMNSMLTTCTFANLDHMLLWYKKHGGNPLNLSILWYSVYGKFGEIEMRSFKKEVADDYMRMKGLKYLEDEYLNGLRGHDKVGCFESLVSHAKTAVSKKINYTGKESHGWQIKTKRSKKEMKGQKRYKRKRADTTLGSFAFHERNEEELFHPDKILRENKVIKSKILMKLKYRDCSLR